MQWMVRWAAMLPSRFLAGKDGRIPYERRRGRKCLAPTEKFGEIVWHKELKSKTEAQNKLETQWQEGVWLGHTRDSDEALIGSTDGVVKAFAVRKKPIEQQWDGKMVKRKTSSNTPSSRLLWVPQCLVLSKNRQSEDRHWE